MPAAIPADFSRSLRLNVEPEPAANLDVGLTCFLFQARNLENHSTGPFGDMRRDWKAVHTNFWADAPRGHPVIPPCAGSAYTWWDADRHRHWRHFHRPR